MHRSGKERHHRTIDFGAAEKIMIHPHFGAYLVLKYSFHSHQFEHAVSKRPPNVSVNIGSTVVVIASVVRVIARVIHKLPRRYIKSIVAELFVQCDSLLRPLHRIVSIGAPVRRNDSRSSEMQVNGDSLQKPPVDQESQRRRHTSQ